MADKSINKSRRHAVRMMLASLASVPLINLVNIAAAQAEDLPHLDEDDPSAKALNYVHDASKANRVDKGGHQPANSSATTASLFRRPKASGDPVRSSPVRL